jgi:light-regulated signal transduction histidine kinase (bacteriophytochrome)
MQQAAERMRAMIDVLLTYSRITTRAEAFTELGLSKPAKKALQILDLMVEESGAKVEIEDLPVVDADPPGSAPGLKDGRRALSA